MHNRPISGSNGSANGHNERAGVLFVARRGLFLKKNGGSHFTFAGTWQEEQAARGLLAPQEQQLLLHGRRSVDGWFVGSLPDAACDVCTRRPRGGLCSNCVGPVRSYAPTASSISRVSPFIAPCAPMQQPCSSFHPLCTSGGSTHFI